jgi:transcriptional regulator with XRE-family HTH domain
MEGKAVQPITKNPKKPDPRFVGLLGEKLRAVRQQTFGSQEALAGKAGVAVQTVANAEAGKPVRRSNALLLAETLGIDLAALLPPGPLGKSENFVPVLPSEEGFPEWDVFSDLIEDKTEGFVGREWVFSAVDRFVQRENKGYCIIEGDPGMGKSSILAEFIKRQRGGCVAFFDVRSMGLNRASQFLESVCSQLVRRFGLQYRPLPAEAVRDGVFLGKILAEISSGRHSGEKIIIAVDALDEVDTTGQSAGSNLLYLPSWLPDGIIFVMTRRRNLLSPFTSSAPQYIIDLLGFPDQNREDIRAYILNALKRPGLRNWIDHTGTGEHRFVDLLTHKSENNFMYLHHVLPAIERGFYQKLDLDALPVGLEGYYYDHWRLMGMLERPLKRNKIDIVYILSEVRQPVSRKLIADFAGVDEVVVQETLNEWGQFLHEDLVDRKRNYVQATQRVS